MGNQIHCHVVKDEYAARVSNLHMYNAVRFVLEVVFKHVLNTVFDIVRHLVFFQLQGLAKIRLLLHENSILLAKSYHLLNTGSDLQENLFLL